MAVRRWTRRAVTVGIVGTLCASAAMGGQAVRVSVSSSGQESDNPAEKHCTISGNGSLVAFASYASNLVDDDTNGVRDIFLHDRTTATTTRISLSSAGQQANGWSDYPSFSADGQVVAFESAASNLVAGDTNGQTDIFVRDLIAATTTRVSVATGGAQANGASYRPALSTDGQYVIFASLADNLDPNDDNGLYDIFVHNRQTGQTERVSVSSEGAQADDLSWRPRISGDGRFAVFESRATDLVDADTNDTSDIFVHDRQTHQTERVSVGPGGVQADGGSTACSTSADGRYVAFESAATNLVADDTGHIDVFVHDRQMHETIRVSVDSQGGQSNGDSYGSSISADGRYVVFDGPVSNLVADDTNGQRDVFVHDCRTGITTRVSLSSQGEQGDDESIWPHISADGRFVAFPSNATNLVPDDLNGPGEQGRDIFLHDRAGDLPGDLDADNDADLDDLTLFQQALNGPGTPASTFAADLDGDGDGDLADFAVLSTNFTGPR